jgi:hypothetical protein
MVINVRTLAGAADTSDQGDTLFRVLSPMLIRGEAVVVSFEGVEVATTSFVNAAFVELLSVLSLAQIKAQVKVVRSSKQINDLIRGRLSAEAARLHAA